MVALHAPAVLRGEVVQTRIDWLPALGLNANFRLDGLGLLFAGLILGIGLLIIFYARFYLDRADPMGRFYSFLMLFQGAMLGIVLSDNILLLLVFWELTSLSSFLLIGYWRHLPEARQGARMALAVTGGGGLALIAGMLILGRIAGSFDLTDILTQRAVIQASPLYLPALLLILLGAFTKSAQVPFHFWLPHAMAAPTPVSAYLHSATMVKAGLFLLARLWPVLSGTEVWFVLVAGTGLVTMLFAAKVALFKDDLKAILAYSTVSHLGLITFLLGIGTKAAAVAAVVHIVAHASFKAALFMLAGIVDHAVHTRDIRRLGGLRRLMPVTFALVALASLSMAGVPPLNGFLSKEMMLEVAAHTAILGNGWILALLATAGAMLSVAYSLRLLAHGFLGAERGDYPARPHDPVVALWSAPAVLVAFVVAMGLLPMPVAGWLVDAAAGAATGAPVQTHLALWHGAESPALWMSLFAFGAGLLVIAGYRPLRMLWEMMVRPEGKAMFDACLGVLVAMAQGITAWLHDGALTRFIAIAVVTIVAAAGYGFATGGYVAGSRVLTPVEFAPLVAWALLLVAIIGAVVLHRQRVLALLLVGVIGLMISVGFAYLAAPDLALTQITVEVVTVVLMLLALNFLPALTPVESGAWRRWRDAVVAGAAGLGVAGLAYVLMIRDAAFPAISWFHLAQSKPGAGGTNAVNTIIVDFRGYDTYGEIIVLGIAALVIFALAEALLAPGPANDRLLARKPGEGDAGDVHPIMFVVATRLMLPIAMMVGTYIFLRGHNLPGGGFVAGLVFAIALVMQYLASGQGWTQARQRIDYHAMIGTGVLIASATGVGSWLAGRPFLTSTYGYVHLPPLEEFELATAALFDLGVFFCVLGAVMLALFSLARLAQRGGDRVQARAFDAPLPEEH
jgi:multicomponent K+:H+ antiporter subunit A